MVPSERVKVRFEAKETVVLGRYAIAGVDKVCSGLESVLRVQVNDAMTSTSMSSGWCRRDHFAQQSLKEHHL
jgi:hypothetical protein